jgi:precorrin-2 dehydrogenase/sirohydrochlorin ferrochelatase
MSTFLPILIDIRNKKCVVIGGGSVAERKTKTLLKHSANITVISPNITNNIKKLIQDRKIKYLKKNYVKDDLEDAFLVIAATSDSEVNAQIIRDAKFLVNNVEKVENLKTNDNIQFIFPAIFEWGGIKIAISTEFPALSKLIKEDFKDIYGKEFALYVRYLKKLRRIIKKNIENNKERERLFRKIASKKIVSVLRQQGFKKAKEEIERIIYEAQSRSNRNRILRAKTYKNALPNG